MFQRMRNQVTINVPDIDLNTVTDIEVTFDQKSSGVELSYTDDAVVVVDENHLTVEIPKSDAMKLAHKPIRYQVMFMNAENIPGASKIYTLQVDELLKDDGYGD